MDHTAARSGHSTSQCRPAAGLKQQGCKSVTRASQLAGNRSSFAMGPKLHKSFDALAKQDGPIVYLRLGVQEIVVVSSAEIAEELLRQKDAEFADRSTKMTRSSAQYVGLARTTVPFADFDDQLKLHRKLMISELLTSGKIKTDEALRTQELAAIAVYIFSSTVQRSTDSEGDHTNRTSSAPVDIWKIAQAVPRNVLFQLALGKRHDDLPPTDELREFPVMAEEAVDNMMKMNVVC